MKICLPVFVPYRAGFGFIAINQLIENMKTKRLKSDSFKIVTFIVHMDEWY